MYGETGTILREEFAALLRQHRIQRRIGTTPAERADRAALIRSYRHGVLAWMCQTMHVAAPPAFSNTPARQPNPFRGIGVPGHPTTAATALADALDKAFDATAGQTTLPAAACLSTPHENPMLDHWRRAAQAAGLAERDTPTPDTDPPMTTGQAQALVGDIAALTQALVILDQRYRLTPGWEALPDSQRLGWTALAAALDVQLGQPDYTVDRIGWRPRTKVIGDPVRPGILGVLQAQHNLVIRMSTTPTAANLRLVVDSQRRLSTLLAPFAARVDPRLGQHWTTRAETYTTVQHQMRDIGGLIGKGGLAVVEGAHAVARAKALPATTLVEPRVLSGFQVLFDRLDHRITDVIEDAITNGTYFRRVQLPRVVADGGQLVHPVRERFVPVHHTDELAIIRTVRDQLRPRDRRPISTPGSSRVDLHSALNHRPAPRGTGPATLGL